MQKLICLILGFVCILNINKTNCQVPVTTKLALAKPMGNVLLKEYQTKIFRAAFDGKLKVYSNDSLTLKLEPSKLKLKLENVEIIPINPDPNDPDYVVDSVIKIKITENDMTGFLASAIFRPDLQKRIYTANFRSFALAYNMKAGSYNFGEQPFFWFKFDELSSIFSATEMATFRSAIKSAIQLAYNDLLVASDTSAHGVNLEKLTSKNAVKAFNRKIYNAAASGRLIAWADKGFSDTINYQKVGFVSGLIEPIHPDSIIGHKITEYLVFDENNLSFTCHLNGLAFTFNFKENHVTRKEEILFWVRFSDLQRLLGEEMNGFIKVVYKSNIDWFDFFSNGK